MEEWVCPREVQPRLRAGIYQSVYHTTVNLPVGELHPLGVVVLQNFVSLINAHLQRKQV